MQYLIQKPDGSRQRVSETEAFEFKTRFDLIPIISEENLIVLARRKSRYVQPKEPLNFGGGRLRNPYQVLSAYRNTREVQAIHW